MSKASLSFSSLEHFQALMSRCPFNRWLQLQAKSVSPEGVEIAMPWRDELMSSPEAQSMHGGVLASLIDVTASYSVAVHVGRGIPTVDLRIDYHKVAKPGDYLAKGRAIQIGRTLSFGEARVYDARGVLVASGRGVFLTRTADSATPAPIF